MLRAWARKLSGLKFELQTAALNAGGLWKFLSAAPGAVAENDEGALEYLLLRVPLDAARWQQVDTNDEGEPMGAPRATVPPDVLAEMALTRYAAKAAAVHVAVLLGGRLELRTYLPNMEFEIAVRIAVREFWKRVVANTPPPPKPTDEALLRELFPRESVARLKWETLTKEQRVSVLGWAFAAKARAGAQKEEKLHRANVIEAIGDFEGIDGFEPGDILERVDFKTRAAGPNNGTHKAIATELLEKLTPRARQRLLEKYTPTDGVRVLRPFFSGGAQ